VCVCVYICITFSVLVCVCGCVCVCVCLFVCLFVCFSPGPQRCRRPCGRAGARGHDEDEEGAPPVEVHQRGEDVRQVAVRPRVPVRHVTAAILLHVALTLTLIQTYPERERRLEREREGERERERERERR